MTIDSKENTEKTYDAVIVYFYQHFEYSPLCDGFITNISDYVYPVLFKDVAAANSFIGQHIVDDIEKIMSNDHHGMIDEIKDIQIDRRDKWSELKVKGKVVGTYMIKTMWWDKK